MSSKAPWVRKTFIRVLPKILLMRPPQYKLETHETEGVAHNVKSDMSTLLGAMGPNSCSNCGPKTDQYFKCAKMRALVPQQTLFPTSGSGEQLIIQDLDVSPLIPIFEPVSNYYSKEVDQVIHNAIFIAHHIGEFGHPSHFISSFGFNHLLLPQTTPTNSKAYDNI